MKFKKLQFPVLGFSSNITNLFMIISIFKIS